MLPDDEAPLTLSKWPFYLGDALLVVTALAIAILGNWQLTDIQVVSCVIAVALGAVIFGLPYVVEYSMRVREDRDDRSSELRLLKGHLQKTEATLLECHERLTELESGSGSVDQRCEILASAVDQKLNHASQVLATLSQQVAAIDVSSSDQAAAFAVLKDQVDAFSTTSKDVASGEAVTALQSALATLEARLTAAVAPLGSIESRVLALEGSAQAVVEVASSSIAEAETSVPARTPRSRRSKADAGLLQRAIQGKQNSASSAVSRIIDSKSQPAKPEPEVTESTEMPEEPVSEQALPNESVSEVTEVQELVIEFDPNEVSEAVDSLPEESEVQIGADMIKNGDLIENDDLIKNDDLIVDEELREAAESETEVIAEAERVEVADDLIVEVTEAVTRESPGIEAEAEGPVDLFGEAQPVAIRRARTKANDAVFTASILIGIGNKPFLRGSAGGLSWQTGIPMDFEEIGKWRWVAPADLDGPVEVQIYRNDEDPDRKGRHTLEPGQKFEVTPVF